MSISGVKQFEQNTFKITLKDDRRATDENNFLLVEFILSSLI
jgi:hypothetical protein